MPQSYGTFSHLCPSVAQESASARPGGQLGTRRIGQGPQAERAVDVHPRLAPPRPTSAMAGNGSNAPVFTSPGLGADQHRAGHVLRQAVGAHPPLIIGRDPAHPVPSQPQQAQGLRPTWNGRSPR